MSLHADAWLSGLMDRDVLRVDAQALDAAEAEAVAADAAVRRRAFYYAKVACDRVDTVARLTAIGFYTVDVNVTFALTRAPEVFEADAFPGITVRPAQAEDGPGVLDVAGSCFRYTRFHLDPQLSLPLAHRIKREWVANFLAKTRGDQLWAALIDGRPVGFLAALLDQAGGKRTATIDLIGVDAGFQRRRVGQALIAAFARHYRGCDVLQVGTQVANVPSIRLYERCGFSLARSQYVLHMHVQEGRVLR